MNESGHLIERKCPVCGKIFVPAPEHVYIEDKKGFCKWSCLCDYRKKKEATKEKRRAAYKHRRKHTQEQRIEAIRKCLEERKDERVVAAELGINYLTVRSWMQAHREGVLKL